MIDHSHVLTVARAEALFASQVATYSQPTRAELTTAVQEAVRAHGGVRGCAGEVAAAYGDYPETAVARMRWAIRVAGEMRTCR